MVRRTKKADPEVEIAEMIEGFKAQDVQEAPQSADGMEEVILVKKTFLYGSVAHAGALVSVPTTIAKVLRAKGIVK